MGLKIWNGTAWEYAAGTGREINDVPSYINPGSRGNVADPLFSTYNFKAANTRKLRSSLTRAAAGTGYSNLVFFGASNTEGKINGTDFDRAKSLSSQFRNAMASLGAPLSGDGMILAGNGANSSPFDPRVVATTGTWTRTSGYATISASAAVLTCTPLYPFSSIDVWYTVNSGTFTVSVDGASSGGGYAAVTPAGGTGWAKVTLTASTGMHTVVVTTTSAAATSIRGFNPYTSSGMLVHNVGVAGWSTNNFITYTLWYQATGIIEATLPPASTDCMFFYDLGVNDIVLGGRTVAQAKADLITLLGRYTNPDKVIFVPPHITTMNQTTQEEYATACYEVADELDLPLIDAYNNIGTYTVGNANGMYGDGAHLTVAGHLDQGRMIAGAVARVSNLHVPLVRSSPSGNLDYPNYPNGTVLVEYTP